MKRFKKVLCLVLTILLVASLSACSFEDALTFVMVEILGEDADATAYRFDPGAFVLFYEKEDAEPIYIPVVEISGYESQYADCNATWYRDQLTDTALTVYNGYLYAMEHCLQGFSLYVPNGEKKCDSVRDLVALDSPFLEQNVNGDGEFTRTWDSTRDGTRIYFHTEQFAKERWDLKMQALEACRKVVREIPAKCETQEEKMQYLYHYVCDQITYSEYESFSGQDYLYDAACLGKTICDGYSNMLLLLYNLIGVEACEVMGDDTQLPEDATQQQRKENVGHTWVMAKLGEKYYHFDPTYEDTTDSFLDERTIYFGVSDATVSNKYIAYDALRPQCDDSSRDFAFTQLTMENIKKEKEIDALANLTDKRAKNEEYVTYVLVNDTIDETSVDKMLDSYVTKVRVVKTVYVSCLEIADKTVLKVTTEP